MASSYCVGLFNEDSYVCLLRLTSWESVALACVGSSTSANGNCLFYHFAAHFFRCHAVKPLICYAIMCMLMNLRNTSKRRVWDLSEKPQNTPVLGAQTQHGHQEDHSSVWVDHVLLHVNVATCQHANSNPNHQYCAGLRDFAAASPSTHDIRPSPDWSNAMCLLQRKRGKRWETRSSSPPLSQGRERSEKLPKEPHSHFLHTCCKNPSDAAPALFGPFIWQPFKI